MDRLCSRAAAYSSPEQVRELVVDELLDTPNVYEAEPGKPRYFWPQDDQIIVCVTGLPEDCALIEATIRDYMAYIGTDNHVRFPVKAVEIDRESGLIRVVGDRSRISEMRPLPRR